MRIGQVVESRDGGSGKPLEGIRILAAEQMQALPYATQLMAHLGADVVKVENPSTGDSARGSRPTVVDVDGRDVGATYLRNNLSKRSIAIDLKSAEGKELFKRLVPRFDVVAENFKPGTLERLGIGYETLSALHPPLIFVSVSGFGNLSPSPYTEWPAYAPIVEAMAGLYEAARRSPEEAPRIGVAGSLGDIGSSLVRHRRRPRRPAVPGPYRRRTIRRRLHVRLHGGHSRHGAVHVVDGGAGKRSEQKAGRHGDSRQLRGQRRVLHLGGGPRASVREDGPASSAIPNGPMTRNSTEGTSGPRSSSP